MMNPPAESVDELLSCSFIILDKPRGPSSHEVTTYLRKLLGVKKVGQMGTLDPKVSGVIIVGVGKAVRLLRFVDTEKKTYVGVMRTRKAPDSLEQVQAEFNHFVGRITQVPPRESAVAKRARRRKVYELRAQDIVVNTTLFEAIVEAGTYIRVLCTEVGKAFGEGRMIELRRVAVGSFDESQAVRLSDIADAVWQFKKHGNAAGLQKILLPAQKLLHIPRLYVADAAVDAIGRGAPLASSDVTGAEAGIESGSWVQVKTKNERLVAIARIEKGQICPKVVLEDAAGQR
jgi:H/ACA ribonucleoprotein complex subunit 4